MTHAEQQSFVHETLRKYPSYCDKRVLEIGSLNVNGTIRTFFNTDEYVGVDIHKGRDVDVVCKGHEFTHKRKFDVVCSTECFEHDEYWDKTIQNMISLCKKDGLFFFTCASTGRNEHGTKRTTGESSLWGTSPDYYENISEEDIRRFVDIDKTFKNPEFFYNNRSKDLYFRGIKK